MKTCKQCLKRKEEEEFNKSIQSADGLYPWCKLCKGVYDRHYRERNIKQTILNGARGNAKRKGLVFDIDEDDIEIPEHCPVLNIPIRYKSENRDYSLSIERVDNTKGYVKGNVMVISARANRLKSDSSIEEMEKILNWRKTFLCG